MERGVFQESIPEFAKVRTVDGVTQIRIKPVLAGWVRIAGWGSLVLIVAGLIGVATTIPHDDADRLSLFRIIFLTTSAATAFVSFLFGTAIMAATLVNGEVNFDGQKLSAIDRGMSYGFPLEQIVAIRQTVSDKSRLEMDTTPRSPKRLFFIGRASWLEVETRDGRFRFFGWSELAKTAWLADTCNRHFLVDRADDSPRQTKSAEDDIVYSSRIYGKTRTATFWGSLAATVIFIAISGWFAYLGLSSNTWPRVTGHVMRSNFEVANGHTTATIDYQYTVRGKTYSNDDLGYGRAPADEVVKKLITGHPDGSEIDVFYSPSNPGRAVVIRGLGLLHWTWVGLSLFPLMLTMYIGFQRVTPRQTELATKYRTTGRMSSSPESLFPEKVRWEMPRDAWLYAKCQNRRAQLFFSVRVILVTLAALWAAHHWLWHYMPPDFPWTKVSLIVTGLSATQLVAALLDFVPAGHPPTYGISVDGVLLPSRDHPIIKWEQIVGYKILPSDELPQFKRLHIQLKSRQVRTITLPENDIAAIEAEFANRFPSGFIEMPPMIGKYDLLAAFAITCVIAGYSAIKLSQMKGHIHGSSNAQWMFLLGLVAGPGTWIAMIRRKWRRSSNYVGVAVCLNFVFTVGTLTAAELIKLCEGR